MFQLNHYALYYTAEQVANAQKNRQREPFKAAFGKLDAIQPLDLTESAVVHSLRWRFNDDTTAAHKAADLLVQDLTAASPEASPLRDAARFAAAVQVFESVRGTPALSTPDETRISDALHTQINAINAQPQAGYAAQVWRALANTAAGIALHDEALFTRGTEAYRHIIQEDIHPDGYIPRVVDTPNGFFDTLLTVQALTLIAEAARHAQVDLWRYSNRGVSIVTAALYPLYFYYYPEKWKWGEQLTPEEVQPLFKTHGTYLEMLNLHIARPTKAIDLILGEQRPVFDALGGGLTTLTHAPLMRRGLFG